MARVVVLIQDLLFGSRVQADLQAAGHEVELVGGADRVGERLDGVDALVVDLTDEQLEGPRLAEELRAQSGEDVQVPRMLGFYSHVDTATRERAQQAGFDMVVPRSRMAREGAALVDRLAERS